MASADFSQFVVTTVSFTACETSRDKPASLSSSTCLIYAHGLRLPFGLHCLWPAYPPCAPYIRFLSVRLRFRYPFFSPAPHDTNLGSRYGVRWQLRPLWTSTTDWRHARHTKKARAVRHGARCSLRGAICFSLGKAYLIMLATSSAKLSSRFSRPSPFSKRT